MYIDSHAYYDLKYFNNNRWELLAKCKKIGVEKILVPAILIESNDSMMQKLDSKENPTLENPDIYYTVGVHSRRVWKGTEKDDEKLESSIGMREVLKYIPLNRILMETDAPYVKPSWCLDDINTSLTIPQMVQELAEIKGISAREVEQVTTENFLKLFLGKEVVAF